MWCKQQHENKHTQHEEGNNINNNTAKCNGNLIDREFNVQKPKQTETYRSISHHICETSWTDPWTNICTCCNAIIFSDLIARKFPVFYLIFNNACGVAFAPQCRCEPFRQSFRNHNKWGVKWHRLSPPTMVKFDYFKIKGMQ